MFFRNNYCENEYIKYLRDTAVPQKMKQLKENILKETNATELYGSTIFVDEDVAHGYFETDNGYEGTFTVFKAYFPHSWKDLEENKNSLVTTTFEIIPSIF